MFRCPLKLYRKVVCIRQSPFTFPAASWQLEPYSSQVAHFCTGSFLHVCSVFGNTIKWTLLTQENFWNILLLLVGRYLAFLTHQCSTRTVLHVRLELLLHLFQVTFKTQVITCILQSLQHPICYSTFQRNHIQHTRIDIIILKTWGFLKC